MKVGVLGAGVWGRAVGGLLGNNGHEVVYRHHGDHEWPEGIDFVLIALPVQHIRESAARFPAPGVPVLSLSKGLEIETGWRVSEILHDKWGLSPAQTAVLSGPNFAAEIARGLPAAAVVASADEALAERFQGLLHQSSFRLYRSTDLVGVELGGALKNVYAIAAGICAGLELGHNAFAALVTRCLAEMTRIGVRLGGRPETFAGLSGVGDLFLTAGSELSRNFRVGQWLGQGESLDSPKFQVGGVAEGIGTTRSVFQLATIPAEEKPVAAQVYAILHEGVSPRQAVAELLGRAAAAEHGAAKKAFQAG